MEFKFSFSTDSCLTAVMVTIFLILSAILTVSGQHEYAIVTLVLALVWAVIGMRDSARTKRDDASKKK